MVSLWHPILPAALASNAKAALKAILVSLPAPDQVKWGASFAGGHAGFALLFGYAALSEAEPIRQLYRDRALAHLETAVGLLALYREAPGLFAGYTGVAWTVGHLQQNGILAVREDLNQELDEALLECLVSAPWSGLSELIDGLAGMGLYALDRPVNARSRLIVNRALGLLQATAESTPRGTTWVEYPKNRSPLEAQGPSLGLYNLGVSHGQAGVIGFLAEAWFRGFESARPLLDTSMSWLLSCKSPHADGSIFGGSFRLGQPFNPGGGRLSWCYGDLGMAAVLLIASGRTGQPHWHDEAVRLALACTERPDPWKGVMDAGFCHGAIGIAHLFARLYHGTNNTKFKDKAIAFYGGALAMRQDTLEAGGFLAYSPSTPGDASVDPWKALPGLLEGATGIGLSLLAATTAVEPCWDRALLVHVPPSQLRSSAP